MAFTSITVTHNFNDGASTAAGTVTFQLTETMTNGTATHFAGETIEASLTAGALSQALPANNDPGTTPSAPAAAQWAVTVRLTGEQARTETYFVTVPYNAVGGTVDLFTLIPSAPQVG